MPCQAPGRSNGRDGFNQLGHLITLGGLTLPDVESCEHRYPVRINRCEFRLDGGGAGCWRGGTGVDYEVEVETEALYSFRGEGLLGGGGYGLNGAGSGGEGEMILVEPAGEETTAPRYGLMQRAPGKIRAASPGGGGWGDPYVREPSAVLRDVLDRVVSVDAARALYGVVLTQNGKEVDEHSYSGTSGGETKSPEQPVAGCSCAGCTCSRSVLCESALSRIRAG